jgi:hypothetical protein
MKEELKNIYISLAKAIERGDNFQIGIVVGQTLTKIENLINDYDTITSDKSCND